VFTDLFDLCRRVDLQKVNRRVMESLVSAGALDCFGGGRAAMMGRLPEALKLADQHSRNCATGQNDLFGLAPANNPAVPRHPASGSEVPEWDDAHRLRVEKNALGLYLTGHPIESCLAELSHYTSGRISTVISTGERDLRGARRGRREKPVIIAGLVSEVRERVGQRGGRMAFVTLEDREGRIEARLFGEVYHQYAPLLVPDEVLVVEGQLVFEEFNDSIRLNAKRLLDLDGAREAYRCSVVLTLEPKDFAAGVVEELEQILRSFNDGLCPVRIEYRSTCAKASLSLGTVWRVRPTRALTQGLSAVLGETRVRLDWKR
jgi:DNA polymerase-3 subunit alpha